MLNFTTFLKPYEQEVSVLIREDGYWDTQTGLYVEGNLVETPVWAAVLPVSNQELQAIVYSGGGSYSQKYAKLILHETLVEGQKVSIGGQEWTVFAVKGYGQHARDLHIVIVSREAGTSD